MSIRSKLIFGFALLLAFILLQAATNFFYGARTKGLVDTAVNRNFTATTEITELLAGAQQLRRLEKEYLIYVGDVDGRNRTLKEWAVTHEKLVGQLQGMVGNGKAVYEAADLAEFGKWKVALDAYHKEFTKVVEGFAYDVSMLDRGGGEAGALAYNKALRTNEDLRPGVEHFNQVFIEGASQLARQRAGESAAAYERIRDNFDVVGYVDTGLSLAGIVLAALLLLTVPASITRPLASLVESADKMSLGDLSKKFEAGGVHDFERLAASLERMRITMEAMMARLKAKSR